MACCLFTVNEQGDEMSKNPQLGLDELMIVNPCPSGTGTLFLGEDGTLYQVQGLGEHGVTQGMGQFFLGDDGTLYQVQGTGPDILSEPAESLGERLEEESGRELGRYFLGEDGTLYERVR
jgi:hypothetical protein